MTVNNMRSYVVILFEGDYDQSDCFCEWAFGKGFDKIGVGSGPAKWNARHIDKLEIHYNGEVRVDMEKMIALWKQAMTKKSSNE